ncbi:probable helicase DDB_G0274399 [Selaginella moellendorffii]|uniref:probable helicase DDB_G0274399 n=1 Tax=Selaginella moellendorffii TaxID=88036 RepID=UPI000D1C26AE|nr:probable helicase DDB_G0274399 [Selaginella moellendorffii]|eukprot:XP_024543048.1 probable helicase DDB_G0274399 [Selaginella moellendorffii]
MLVTESTWHLNKLTSVTTFIREQQAMAAMHLFPLLETILSASPPREISRTQSLPPQLRSKLRREYNESQLSSIAAVADQMISLIQGPPGTGKTRTILGIVSALLAHANEEAGKAEEHEMLDVLTDKHQTKFRDKLKATRILVCAQSNAAVDELVTRISKHGVYNYDGGTYWPSIVRVGDTKRVHSQAMAVHIDRLVAKRMAENAGVHNAHSPQELRSKLDEVLGNMQALAAPAEVESQDGIPKLDKLAGLQEQQRLLLSELIKVENREHGFLMGSNRKKKQAMKLEVLREADVVLTTLSGCGGHIYSTLMEFIATRDAQAAEMLFDAVIIDEAAQAVEPSTLIPLQLLKATRGKCILIGDPKQLPATVLSVPASRLLFDCSMFERFQKHGYPVSMLTTQYRMHPEIRSFPSTHYYGGQLKDGSTVLHGNRSATFHRERCFEPYRFFDIRDGQERPGSMQSLTNPDEAEFIFQLLRVLKERYPEEVRPGRIGVITPYQEQRKVLQENMRSLHSGIDVNTVDSFQGREADIIVLSTVRASFGDSQAGVGFLADVRRMNVALTRAKFSLWVVGNARTLERNPDWKALLQDCRRRGLVSSVRKPYHSAINGLHSFS